MSSIAKYLLEYLTWARRCFACAHGNNPRSCRFVTPCDILLAEVSRSWLYGKALD